MVLTRLEKVAFLFLVSLLGAGIFLLIGKVGLARQKNNDLKVAIAKIAALTDQTVLIKDEKAFSSQDNDRKLNLNRANELSISTLPGMNSALAKRVYEFIQKRGSIKSLGELSQVKGMSKNKLRNLELYATTWGGHAGQAAWGEKLNLNFASEDEIEALPGIGKKTARDIVDFRNRNGGFFSLEDLKEIPGLTDSKIKKFIDQVEVR
ncbi:MAG: competence protein ComEA [Clostridiales bacterium]|jgi:competence ComEA-like helix-hairpin-helix protein|nr:competence protein ComEA [Clostridiales bacterium]MDN5283309.1 competence protein ComEA [Candidatus Ozemobacter sp.]